MKKNLPFLKKPFNHLMGCLIRTSDQKFIVNPSIGEGSVRRFPAEDGLEAWILDCRLTTGIQIQHYLSNSRHQTYYTVIYFLETDEVKLSICQKDWDVQITQDRLFLSPFQDQRVCIAPMTNLCCLCIGFSTTWLYKVSTDSPKLNEIHEVLSTTQDKFLSDSMTHAEKEEVRQLIELSNENHFGSFYIRTAVLKLIIDFVRNLCVRRFSEKNTSISATIGEIKSHLREHVTNGTPDLKALSEKFCLSASTLKRQFKKHVGVTMTAYFIQSKMEYAQQLISKQGRNARETARLVGYRSTHKFNAMYKKYHHQLTLPKKKANE